LPWT
jgi:hypothetical protein